LAARIHPRRVTNALALPDGLVPLHRVLRPARLASAYVARALTPRA